MKLVFLLLMTSIVASQADAQTVCKGNVSVSHSANKRFITISFDELEYQSWISLSSLIISDLEPDVSFQITKVTGAQREKLVSATYEGSIAGFVSFKYIRDPSGASYIKNFRGTEEGAHFGPSDLTCESLRF